MTDDTNKTLKLLARHAPLPTFIIMGSAVLALLIIIARGGGFYLDTIVTKLDAIPALADKVNKLEAKNENMEITINTILAAVLNNKGKQ